jgi:hypothetical protein
MKHESGRDDATSDDIALRPWEGDLAPVHPRPPR